MIFYGFLHFLKTLKKGKNGIFRPSTYILHTWFHVKSEWWNTLKISTLCMLWSDIKSVKSTFSLVYIDFVKFLSSESKFLFFHTLWILKEWIQYRRVLCIEYSVTETLHAKQLAHFFLLMWHTCCEKWNVQNLYVERTW